MESLTFRDTVVKDGVETVIIISINDTCNNGYQYFSITYDQYLRGRLEACGCGEDTIREAYGNKYDDFLRLHGCDYKGIPMYAVENGMYHMTDPKMSPEAFQAYYRVTALEYAHLKAAVSKVEYSILLEDLGIIARWRGEALKAIGRLESITGETFTPKVLKPGHYTPVTPEVRQEYELLQASGYFTIKQKAQRAKVERRIQLAKHKKDILDDYNKKVQRLKDDKAVKLLLLKYIPEAFHEPIYYNHNNTVVFNWRYEYKLPRETYDKFMDNLSQKDLKGLPEGITFLYSRGTKV